MRIEEDRLRYLIVCTLWLAVLASGAIAQDSARPAASEEPSARADSHAAAVANCVQMWDRGTHMTRKEWLRTCQRVQNRLQQLPAK
jgi:hypothetical protein